MRVLITGSGGFVGGHLREGLVAAGHHVTGLGIHPEPGVDVIGDVTDATALTRLVAEAQPDAVVHLAGSASVSESAKNPALAFRINAGGALNVCQAVIALKAKCRLLLVSSGEVYGGAAGANDASEAVPPDPMNVYGASKLAGEIVARQHRFLGLDVVIARPFNHLGRGQVPTFVLPSFAQQLAKVPRGAEVTLEVGNLTAVRDFSHVADVVQAYLLLLARGESGRVYNIGSGQGRSIQQLLEALIAVSGRRVTVKVDPARLRPVEIPRLVGDAAALRALGWQPQHTVDQALAEVLAQFEAAGSR